MRYNAANLDGDETPKYIPSKPGVTELNDRHGSVNQYLYLRQISFYARTFARNQIAMCISPVLVQDTAPFICTSMRRFHDLYAQFQTHPRDCNLLQSGACCSRVHADSEPLSRAVQLGNTRITAFLQRLTEGMQGTAAEGLVQSSDRCGYGSNHGLATFR